MLKTYGKRVEGDLLKMERLGTCSCFKGDTMEGILKSFPPLAMPWRSHCGFPTPNSALSFRFFLITGTSTSSLSEPSLSSRSWGRLDFWPAPAAVLAFFALVCFMATVESSVLRVAGWPRELCWGATVLSFECFATAFGAMRSDVAPVDLVDLIPGFLVRTVSGGGDAEWRDDPDSTPWMSISSGSSLSSLPLALVALGTCDLGWTGYFITCAA